MSDINLPPKVFPVPNPVDGVLVLPNPENKLGAVVAVAPNNPVPKVLVVPPNKLGVVVVAAVPNPPPNNELVVVAVPKIGAVVVGVQPNKLGPVPNKLLEVVGVLNKEGVAADAVGVLNKLGLVALPNKLGVVVVVVCAPKFPAPNAGALAGVPKLLNAGAEVAGVPNVLPKAGVVDAAGAPKLLPKAGAAAPVAGAAKLVPNVGCA